MLTVKTYLDKSSINGLGCFAEEFIASGSVLWTLNKTFDVVITKEEIGKLPDITKQYMEHFAYFNENEGGYVLCSDNAKYFNHSIEPNCIAQGLSTVAVKDIRVGEEITENYFNFDELAKQKLENHN